MDKYDVIKAIGEGAFGKAYLAKGKSDSKHCVMKEIDFTKMPIQEKEASKKEVILQAKMKYPNIVTFFSSFQGLTFYSMELAQTCVGTPYYLSPEICQNKPYNNKMNIWSLGCVLYELCTLKHPFEGNNLHQLVLKICQACFAPVSPWFSHDLSLISQLFKVSPRDRLNSILKKPFLENLIAKCLTPEVIQEEFGHAPTPGVGVSAPQSVGKVVQGKNDFNVNQKHLVYVSHIKMIERPKLAGCSHYDYYYAQLDLLRKRDHEPSYHCVSPKATRVKENYSEEESHSPSPGQPAEYLQRKSEAQQYKLKVEKQWDLRPPSAEPNHKRQELRSCGKEPRLQKLPLRRNKMKEQFKNRLLHRGLLYYNRECWRQLEEIRQQYHNDMKEIREKMGRALEEDSTVSHKTYLVKRSNLTIHQETPEEEAPVQEMIFLDVYMLRSELSLRGVINLDKCISKGNILKEEEAVDMLTETLTFEDGMKFKEHRQIKEREDYTDEAFEKLCSSGAELFLPDAAAAEHRRQWEAGAPPTLLHMMAAADVTSICSTRSEVSSSDGQMMVIKGVPGSRKQWRLEAPGTSMSVLAATHVTSNSFSSKEECGFWYILFIRSMGCDVLISVISLTMETLKQWLPKENEGRKVEMTSGIEVDEQQLQPRSDDDDTNFEESEDKLRNEIVESLKKLTASKEEKKKKLLVSSLRTLKSQEKRIRMQKYAELNEHLGNISISSN
ncbi:LOW QUALITY PROTEIN: serine/threonine-protein kinase Nek5 [Rhynchonycteris naso]